METKAKRAQSKNLVCVGHCVKKWTRGLRTCDSSKIWMSNATTRLTTHINELFKGFEPQFNFQFSSLIVREWLHKKTTLVHTSKINMFVLSHAC